MSRLYKKLKKKCLAMVVPAFNPSTLEEEIDGSLNLSQDWTTEFQKSEGCIEKFCLKISNKKLLSKKMDSPVKNKYTVELNREFSEEEMQITRKYYFKGIHYL